MLLHGVLAAVIAVVAVELALRVPLLRVARRAMGLAHKARRTVQSLASDHWKERAMRAYAGRMFATTATLCAQLLLLGALVGALVLAASAVAPEFVAFIAAPTGLAISLIVATIYSVGRARAR